jgi:hypothetical protein
MYCRTYSDRVSAALIALCFLASLDIAHAATAKKAGKSDSNSDADAVCDMDIGGSGIASKPLNSSDGSGSHRYLVSGICFDLSGNAQLTGQTTQVPEPRVGPGPTSQRTLTINPDFRIESAKRTNHGALKTAFEIDWSYNTDTGPDSVPTLDEASITYVGFTVGYTDSLMNFWDSSDFQFTVSAPNRTSYLISYQYSFTDELKGAIAVEAGSPTSRGATTWQLPNAPPYFTTQLRYDKNDWTLHTSAAAHEIDVRGAPLLGVSSASRWGWAASSGVTIPFKFIAKDDTASAQVTYAVDSSIFLGTPADVSSLAARFPTTGPTRGWSAVASYHHDWSNKWASNAFVSHIALDLDLVLTKPSVRTTRIGANLTYQPREKWQIGVEVDVLDTQIDINGPLGILPSTSLKGQTAYLWIKYDL